MDSHGFAWIRMHKMGARLWDPHPRDVFPFSEPFPLRIKAEWQSAVRFVSRTYLFDLDRVFPLRFKCRRSRVEKREHVAGMAMAGWILNSTA